MTAKRMYIESSDLKPLVEWLKTKPEGECMVLIGDCATPVPSLMASVTSEGRELAEWVAAKMQAGELSLRAMREKANIPIGEVFEG